MPQNYLTYGSYFQRDSVSSFMDLLPSETGENKNKKYNPLKPLEMIPKIYRKLRNIYLRKSIKT